MTKKIIIGEDLYSAIQEDAVPFEDTPDSVLRKWAFKLGKIDKKTALTKIEPISPEEIFLNGRIRKHYRRYSPPKDAVKITQRKVIPYIIISLRKLKGAAPKKQVEEEVYALLNETFKHPWYHENVSWGTPRWKHFISWAKQIAVNKGLIVPGEKSERGVWKLTELGKSPMAFKE